MTVNVNESTLSLTGSANSDADAAVGLFNLRDIEFSVDRTIAGLQHDGLITEPVIVSSDLDVNHGYTDYLLIKVHSALYNPRCATTHILPRVS